MDEERCTWVTSRGQCILDGRETPPDDRILCRDHRDKLIEQRVNHERRMTRRASDARIHAPE